MTVTSDTQAILLLCARLERTDESAPRPLTPTEYHSLATWLVDRHLQPAELLSDQNRAILESLPGSLDSARVRSLLGRRAQLTPCLERWANQGFWVLGSGDVGYPHRLRQQLPTSAPPVLFGLGDPALMECGGLAIVGSRDASEEALEFTRSVAQRCAKDNIPVVSGGARGIDNAALSACLEADGRCLAILADGLGQLKISPLLQRGLEENRLALITSFAPEGHFSVQRALTRNRYIYALAEHALVSCFTTGKGGTWSGAVEYLRQSQSRLSTPVFVRQHGNPPEGFQELLQLGAYPFPEEAWKGSCRALLELAAKRLPALTMLLPVPC